MTQPTAASVLIVEDHADLAELYAEHLEPDYDVTIATSGLDALEHLGDGPDLVLLDRRMPGMTGDQVAERIRERDLDVRVAMVTAIDPDIDIIDLPIDGYLEKPVEGETLIELVEHLEGLDELDDLRADLSAKRVKRNVLEVEKDAMALATNEEFLALVREIDELEARLDSLEAQFEDNERVVATVG